MPKLFASKKQKYHTLKPTVCVKIAKSGVKHLRQGHGGLAVLTSTDIHAFQIPFDGEWAFLAEYAQLVWIDCGVTSQSCIVVNVYLPTHAAAAPQRSQIMQSLFSYIATFSLAACVCAEIFKTLRATTHCRSHYDGWIDIQALKDATLSVPTSFTYSRSGWRTQTLP